MANKVILVRYVFTYYSNVNFMPPSRCDATQRIGADAPLTPGGGKHLSAVSLWKAGLFINTLTPSPFGGRMSARCPATQQAGQDGGSLNIS